ncbi:MAG: hypothetical protein LBH72_01195 [Proteiniphilum sp.]|jgi:hypothetical protein|nr:hypothetical protein [Proteiniphilum sp.]
MKKQIISTAGNGAGKRAWSFVISSLLLAACLVTCGDINSIHQEYYDRGEDIYTGVVDSIKVFPGYEKALLVWEINADPRITETVIYWNQREDSAIVSANRNGQIGRLPMSYSLDELKEGDYVFEFVTRDDEGHHSMTQEAAALIYGESYTQTLRNRNVSSITKNKLGDMLIVWGPITGKDAVSTTIVYAKKEGGADNSVRVGTAEMETELRGDETGLKTGDKISIFTSYLPENALEPLHSPAREYTLPKFEQEIDKVNFRAVVLPGDNTSVNQSRDLQRIWDGNTRNTGILHTVEGQFGFPHHFTFDMGVVAEISRFRLWPRVDAAAFTGHSPRSFEVWGAETLKEGVDETYWTSDEWRNDWKILGAHEITRPATEVDQIWNAGWEYKVNEEIGGIRYIRLVIKEPNWQNSNCVNIGEITLWGDPVSDR